MMSKFNGDKDKKALLDYTLNEMQKFLDTRHAYDQVQRAKLIATDTAKRAEEAKEVTEIKTTESKGLQLELFGG